MPVQNKKKRLSRKARQRRAICVFCIAALLLLSAVIILIVRMGSDTATIPTPMSEDTAMTSSSEASSETAMPAITSPDDEWQLRLVNNTYGLDAEFEPPTLKTVQKGYVMDERAADYMLDMILAANDDGVKLYITSAYRSIERQQTLVENSVKELVDSGYSEEEAYTETYKTIAKPGKSEHNLGLAADIVSPEWYSYHSNLNADFENTPQFAWLQEHAAEYGFILRYPKDKVEITEFDYEPWHYRYVGKEHAQAIKELGVCLEEYLGKAD